MNQPEVSHKDYLESTDRSGKSFNKINACRKLAHNRGIDWVWIDTCCIDKRSSVELSKSISSMYRWYVGAQICYAYLDDVVNRDILGEVAGVHSRLDSLELLATRKVRIFLL